MKRTATIILLILFMIMDCKAQGIIFYKKDGTQLKVPYAKLDSMVTYSTSTPGEVADTNYIEYDVDGIKFRLRKVQGGTFTMGANSTSKASTDRMNMISSPAHQVTLSDYCIGETEVTQELWYSIMGTTPVSSATDQWTEKYGLGDKIPCYRVFYSDIRTFLIKLNAKTGESFRLPTEAEWEFAAKGGNLSKGYLYSGSDSCQAIGWVSSNSDRTFHSVKQKLPNELGLYDMTGNVEEMCNDWLGDYSTSPETNPTGPTSGTEHVTRGGDALNDAVDLIYRGCDQVSFRVVNIGFRLARNK